jgi:hypothetical protein
MDKRIPLVVVVGLLLAFFLIEPAATATVSSPSRTTEVIPIDVNESWKTSEKEISIAVQGAARVTAAGDAYFSLSITTSECDIGSSEAITTRSSATVTISEFVKYRDAVAAFNRGEIDSPLPQAAEQQSTKTYYGPKYYWYGIRFVAPGDPYQYIDFDHPDNYDTYYPRQWNAPWLITSVDSGWKKWVHHVDSGTMQLSVSQANLFLAISSMAFAIGLAIYWVLGLILGIIAGIGLGVAAFLYWIMQSEQLDGWGYTHDNLANHNRLISFGAWRDWGWYVGQW